MLWVIQRDFLQGKSVQQLVTDALAPVPNPHKDQAIAETNNIRASLASIARNSTGFRCALRCQAGTTGMRLEVSGCAAPGRHECQLLTSCLPAVLAPSCSPLAMLPFTVALLLSCSPGCWYKCSMSHQ